VNKNASDKVFDGSYRAPPTDPRFSSVFRQDFTPSKSILAKDYTKQVPPGGFDRLTANRTNYSLGSCQPEEGGVVSATSELQMTHPNLRPRVDQANLGGWVRPGKGGGQGPGEALYHQDIESMDSMKRGGGGEGVLGVRFDIVTGGADPGARARVLARAGPRRTLNNMEKERLHPTDAWGDTGGEHVDVITGIRRARPLACPLPTAASLRRPGDAVRRTRPW
ncbi:unnamed protein product, partial [Discosporangium mesarthrocarpum]